MPALSIGKHVALRLLSFIEVELFELSERLITKGQSVVSFGMDAPDSKVDGSARPGVCRLSFDTMDLRLNNTVQSAK